jgi:hypothetical protein
MTRVSAAAMDVSSVQSLPTSPEVRLPLRARAQNDAKGAQRIEVPVLRSRHNCFRNKRLPENGSARSAKTQNPGHRSPGPTAGLAGRILRLAAPWWVGFSCKTFGIHELKRAGKPDLRWRRLDVIGSSGFTQPFNYDNLVLFHRYVTKGI